MSTCRLPIPQRNLHKGNTVLSAINVSRALLRLISVTVFRFSHPLVLSALLILSVSVSGFLVIDFLLLIPSPFPSSALLHGTTSPFSPTEPLSGLLQFKPQDMSIFQNNRLAMFSSHCCYLFPPQVPVQIIITTIIIN